MTPAPPSLPPSVDSPSQAAIFLWLEKVLHVVEIPFVSRPEGYSSQRVNHLKDPAVSAAAKAALVRPPLPPRLPLSAGAEPPTWRRRGVDSARATVPTRTSASCGSRLPTPGFHCSQVRPLAEASEAAWQAILSMDAPALGAALSATMGAWAAMLPYTVDPYLGDDEAKTRELRAFVAKYDAPHTLGCLFSGAGGGFLMVISEQPVHNGLKVAWPPSYLSPVLFAAPPRVLAFFLSACAR